ncbi:RDD family protein [Streptomyces sp. MST-110588]|uniref:RDD family protein n=1 Tax=Streptomyces sp. MST-110588 TaxID=2833628 RepID=UPI001F5C6AF1|nr:RDD family protein [Streptomyces sp. MST-110588]UNO41805.1 RDD family protein [Streptomyces sp. MST-110588]
MSAPTSGSAGGSPTPGFYPDPSIPGYIRYWSGAAWVPGTSRPAPGEGEPMPAPPAGVAVAPPAPAPAAAPASAPVTAPAPAVEETGPVFLDGEGEPQAAADSGTGRESDARPAAIPWQDPARPSAVRPAEPSPAWQADASQQEGFGGEQDRRISWGAQGAGRPGEEASPAVPPQRDETGVAPAAGAAAGASAASAAPSVPSASPSSPASGSSPSASDGPDAPRSDSTVTIRALGRDRDAGPRENTDNRTTTIRAVRAEGPDDAGEGGAAKKGGETMFIRLGSRGEGGGSAAPGITAPQVLPSGGGARQAPGRAAAPDQRVPGQPGPARQPAAGGPAGRTTAQPQPQPRPPAQPQPHSQALPGPQIPAVPGPVQPAPTAPAAPTAHGPRTPGPAMAPRGAPHGTPHAAGFPPHGSAPATPGPVPGVGGPGPGPAQGGGAPEGVIPWKPPVNDPFAAAREQGRPAGLGRRLLARLIDTLVLGGITGAVAVPLWIKAGDHIDEKVEAAKQSGRQVTVYLLDGTTAPYLGIVLATLLVAGVLYDALPTAKWGRTLGKKLCGVKVLDIEGHDSPSFGAALKRWLVYGVLGVLAVGIVNVVWCLFDRPWRQCWHDKAARTFVAQG